MTDAVSHAEASESVDARHWRVVLGTLRATFRTGSFVRGAEMVAQITDVAEAANHHPDLFLRYPDLTVSLVSHDIGRLSARDVDLARRISALADELGVSGDPGAPQALEVGVDAMDIPALVPFWSAVLGYLPAGDDRLVDPSGAGPVVWFQQMSEPRPQRNRVHLDVDVPHDAVQQRLRAALDAGGRLLDDSHAPAFWVLADAEGNEVCLCTWQGRGD
jgi:4a-hydroxytetrahydrobiopterin dehydratase